MLMIFVTIFVIHIYSDCALGTAKKSVRQRRRQTSSCCPKEFANCGNPMDAEGEGGTAGGRSWAEPRAGDAQPLGQWS